VTVAATVAVKITGWLTADGEGEAVTAVVVAVPETVWANVPAPALKLLSPEYVAVMVYAPCEGKEAVQVAVVIVPKVLTVDDAQRVTGEPPPSA